MKGLHSISFILVVVGALNWGLVGLGSLMGNSADSWNVVKLLLGSMPTIENLVYLLVGLAAVSLLVSHKKDCRYCSAGAGAQGMGM